MKFSDFTLGGEFYCGGGKWRCTDIGTRVVVAIRIDQITVHTHNSESNSATEKVVTDDPSWFNGPPYAVAEHVFDEYGFSGCSLEPVLTGREIGHEVLQAA